MSHARRISHQKSLTVLLASEMGMIVSQKSLTALLVSLCMCILCCLIESCIANNSNVLLASENKFKNKELMLLVSDSDVTVMCNNKHVINTWDTINSLHAETNGGSIAAKYK